MKTNVLPLLTQLLVAVTGLRTTAQSVPPPAGPAGNTLSAGLVNDWLRDQSPTLRVWDIGGQFRLRFEHKAYFAAAGQPGASDFRAIGGNPDNTYWLTRAKLHVGYTPASWLGTYVEGRNSTSTGDDRDPNPESDSLALHQAYVTVGDTRQFPLASKVGRQEMVYGDERLIGALDWSNVGRVFDAAKLRYEQTNVWVDAFAGRVVLVDDNNFNRANDYDWLSGVYASSRTLIPKQETQVYFLSRNVSPDSPTAIGPGLPPLLTGASPRDIYTVGLRVKSLPGQWQGWDYDAELAGQFGRFKTSASSASLEQQALAAHGAAGYTWAKAWGTPRVGVEYNFASGDSNPKDDQHGTFDNLFPTNHKFYGYMDFVSWQNIHNARLSTSLKPVAKLTLTADYHAFWLADTRDYFYQVNGAPRNTGGFGINPEAGSFVGTELDLIATYAIRAFASGQVGYGHFFVGEYVKNSLVAVGGAHDANYVYAQLTFNF